MNRSRIDEILGLLVEQDRRQIIFALEQSSDGVVGVDELAEAIHEKTHNREDAKDQLVIEMYHNHLPRFHEQGVIEYDPRNMLVRYTPDKQFEAVVESVSAAAPSLVSDDERQSSIAQ